MDANLKNFPVLSYVMSRLPSIGPLRPSPPSTSADDLENPSPPPPPPPADPAFTDTLIERMPHLKDPKVMATMSAAVAEISKTRSILQTLGERPDHETIDFARAKLNEIEHELAHRLDEISLEPGSSSEDQRKREDVEREKAMFKAIIRLDEMHDAYEKLLRGAEEKLMRIYDSAVVEKEEVEEAVVEMNEEVAEVLKMENVEKVDLSGKKLRILPDAFGKMRSLVSVNLSSNQLQTLPDSIAGLENLEELNLSSNSLISLPDSIGLLLKLKILNVSGNKLTALPDSICHCRSLVELDASFNSLGYLPTNIGFELVNLKKLLVHYNKIRSLPTSIGEMVSLQHLDVHFNELHGLPYTIGQCTNLLTLNLSGNFSDLKELPETMGDLVNLEELDLSNNQIHALPNSFGRLEKLKKLNLDQNPIVIPPLEVVKQGVEAVNLYMAKRWVDLLVEEEEKSRQAAQAEQETGWLKRSVSKLGGVVSSVSEYLGSPKAPHDPCLDQQL